MSLAKMSRRLLLCQAVSSLVSRRIQGFRCGPLSVLRLSRAAQPAMDPLFILCEARTGSTMLCDLLDSHPMLDCVFEILNLGEIPLLRACRSESDVHFYLDTLFKAIPSQVGCGKIHLTHLEELAIDSGHLVCWFPQARFLVLYRASLLDQFVSLKLAQLTGRWIARRPEEETRRSITVDPSELSAFARRTTRRYRELMDEPALLGRHLTISYEEIVADANAVFNDKIWSFLGLPPVPVSTVLRRQNRLPVEDCVANLEELRSALARSSGRSPLAPFQPRSARPRDSDGGGKA